MSLDPILRSLHVRLEPEPAFHLFTADMSSWWPRESHSRAEDDQVVDSIVFEGWVGGRIYEIMTDGSEGEWGAVTAWEPSRRVVFDWNPTDVDRPPTEVEVRFTPAEGGGTIVELEHRGWERLGPDNGPTARESYDAPSGWGRVFEHAFAVAAGVAA